MRKFTLHAALIGALLVVFGAGSYALADGGKSHIKADDMTGYLEGAPGGPVSSVASGNFEAVIDDAADEIHYTLSYSGLEGDVRQAHIHFGQRSVNAGIMLWLCETSTNPSPTGPATPDCPQSGTVTGVLRPSDVVGPTGQGIAAGEFAEALAAIRAGRAYANVHSSKFPGGEIRAQLNDDDQRDD
jgi:CHRD domain